ncbi:troponin C-like [Polistes fuscatus]|uniref:troponin C-like n=1 Tax=Polistes fuscatus TaxID=30207 RepID=UPI001CA7E63A|nr:troponin C-like [Polistes fuscatus]
MSRVGRSVKIIIALTVCHVLGLHLYVAKLVEDIIEQQTKKFLLPLSSKIKNVLRRAFSMFDSTKSGRIEKEKVRTILNTLGHTFDDHELEVLLKQEDEDGSGKLNFDSFYRVATHFQEEDDEALQKELKEAFRLYDKEGNGYIPTSSLREILAALDDQITPDQMDGMIAEIDTDGSGTVDFDEFMEMMTGD